MEGKKVVLDTNIILAEPKIVNEYESIILPIHILEELDGLKKADGELGYKAREGMRQLKEASNIEFQTVDKYNIDIDGWDLNKRDNQIIYCAKVNGAKLISNDFNVYIKANSIGVECQSLNLQNKEDTYKGYKEVWLDTENDEDNEILSKLYSESSNNVFDILINEYLVIYDKARPIYDNEYDQKLGYEVIDKIRWDGISYQPTFNKTLTTNMFGRLKPKDVFQECAIDSLFENKITMIKGKAGAGKSLIALNFAMYMIEKGKADKLIIFTNPQAAKNSVKLGYYPGDRVQKLNQTSLGGMLSSKFGDQFTVERYIQQGKIELVPFADIRGYDTSGMNAIIWFAEAQNLDVELMRLGMQRIGEDCKTIIDGDYTTQVDSSAFENEKNGMRRLSEVFRNHDFYGEVNLPYIYRSKVAKLADEM